MLVLKRNIGERILIGDNIAVTLVDASRDWARLGIEAPRDVPVYRQELLPVPAPTTLTPAQERLAGLRREEQSAVRLSLALHRLRGPHGPAEPTLPRSHVLACDALRAIRAEIAELEGGA